MPVRADVVVTGGAGFIGSELVAQLVSRGHRVRVIDTLVNGRREYLDVLSGVDLCVVDVRDQSRVASVLSEAAVVFHLACLGVRHSLHSPVENQDVNATGTLRLVEACRRAGVGRFVCVSTSEVYGTARRVPMTEDHPTAPETVYGASKLAGEQYALAAWRTHRYPVVVVRPFNVFGPRSHHEGDSGEVIPKFMLRALAGEALVVFGDGHQTRDFTFVADTARAILGAGFADGVIGHVINVGSGREISVLVLAALVGAATRQSIRIEHAKTRPGDVRRLCGDSQKARRLLSFEPTVTIAEGLARLLEWYRVQPQSPAELLRQEVIANWRLPPGLAASS